MSNRYILNPDGSIQKYDDNNDATPGELEAKLILSEDDVQDTEPATPGSAPAENLENISSHNTVTANIAFGSLSDFFDGSNEHVKIVDDIKNIKSFGFEGKEGTIESYKPFNTFSNGDKKPKVFANELEILGGIRYEKIAEDFGGVVDDFGTNIKESFTLVASLFSYFAESIIRLALVEAIILVNRLLQSSNQDRIAERYILKIGKYDFTEYDLFTRYIFNVLNYPHESSTIVERISAYFIGFAEWLAPDAIIDFSELVKDKTTHSSVGTFENDLDGLFGSNKIKYEASPFITDLAIIAYAAIKVLLANLTNNTVQNRANLLFRKFYQERYWHENILYKAKEDESEITNLFTDLNYYYFKFYIERIQIGLKLVNKYVYNDSYLKSNKRDTSFQRVSGQRSSKPGLISFSNEDSATEKYKWLSYRDTDEYDKKRGQQQTTRIRALPQLFSMHPSLYKALSANNCPKIELGKDLLQNFATLDKSQRRISNDLVDKIENLLEAEYMPFYLHDIRTNEIISFHAFIDSIADSFNPEYNSASGFGRIDDVRSYVKTSRNINLSFTIAATSESDHDLMWYQINKIVAMTYPQWSDGYPAIDDKDFKYPFTQVPTASPLIRLRVGDVIKSNYSRTNLSRLFGVGERDDDTNQLEENTKTKLHYELMPGLYRTATKYEFNLGMKSVKIDSPVPIKNSPTTASKTDGKFVEVEIEIQHGDSPDPTIIPPSMGKTMTVIADASKIIAKRQLKHKNKASINKDTKGVPLMEPMTGEKSNNPITKSYESGMSRGLAGFITQLDVNYNDVVWETSRIGSKAPMLVKITINFAPIHDIPPGLDHNGMLRAPIYNVGRINNQFFGDPKDHSYTSSGRDKALAKYKQLRTINNF